MWSKLFGSENWYYILIEVRIIIKRWKISMIYSSQIRMKLLSYLSINKKHLSILKRLGGAI